MLNTKRLRLRPWRIEDITAFARLAQDPQVMRYIGTGELWDGDRIRTWIEKQIHNFENLGYSFFAMVEVEKDDLIGICGAQQLSSTDDLEIGWWVRTDRWGHGYATEAALRIRDFVFETTSATELFAVAIPENIGSISVMKKIGMEFNRECDYEELGGQAPGINLVVYRMPRPLATL